MRRKVVAHFFDVRIMYNLDSAFLEFGSIRRFVCQVVRHKSDAVAKLTKQLENLKHPKRARILVRFREMMVDHEDIFFPSRRLPQKHPVAIN